MTVGEAAGIKFKLCSYIFGVHKHRPLVFIILISLLSYIDPLDIWEELDQSSLRQFSRHLLAWDRTLAACVAGRHSTKELAGQIKIICTAGWSVQC